MPRKTKKVRCHTCRRTVIAEFRPGVGWIVRKHTTLPGNEAFGKPEPPVYCAGEGVVVP